MLQNHKFFSAPWLISAIVGVFISCSPSPKGDSLHSRLAVRFEKEAKLEVGGPYAGAAFHHSHMAPQRISFFYPVANSIDNSRDYWTRDTSHVMELRLKIDDGEWEELGQTPAAFELAPYSVRFQNEDEQKAIAASYQFCGEKPAMVISYTLSNRSKKAARFVFETRLTLAIKSCHTYKLIGQASTSFDAATQSIYAGFTDTDADSAMLFVANAASRPLTQNWDASRIIVDNQESTSTNGNVPEKTMKPVAQFRYEEELRPGAELQVVQIVGSCRPDEAVDIVAYLKENYWLEIERFESDVQAQAFEKSIFRTGTKATDRSTAYAKAVMAANAHYLDGEIVPMPCPAEYNFYFTHDALVTDLAAVKFDPDRVRNDLLYIIQHADSQNVIPHAYYWKDGRYQTEFASSDNWNNFWFIIVSAAYLRHTRDIDFLNQLLPYLSTSVERAMLTKEADNLMWSYRPDWWDIGHNYGPRAYMTILAIKTLRDFVYISANLDTDEQTLQNYSGIADSMEAALITKLWNDDFHFLMNYLEDGSLDPHYYIGSLLAAHYCSIEAEKARSMVESARQKMVDEKVGIYNAYPMDFMEYRKKLSFGDEVGQPNYYFNGGIWPQGNAWYALALIATGRRAEALSFVENTMSFDGILNGPNGQPAYYEVRNPDRDDPQLYGAVDKPQFLWAGAWYLYSLYASYGLSENSWNISFDPFLPPEQKQCSFTLAYRGKLLPVTIQGQGKYIRDIRFDGKKVLTAVLPLDTELEKSVDIQLGLPRQSYLKSCNATLQTVPEFHNGELICALGAFPGYRNETQIVSREKPVTVTLNGRNDITEYLTETKDGVFETRIHFVQQQKTDILCIRFE